MVKVGPQIKMLENLGFTSCTDGWLRLSEILKVGGERIFRCSLNGERFWIKLLIQSLQMALEFVIH